MYNTNMYISQPNWGLHPLLFYCWLLRPCFLPFWYSLAFLFFPVLIACFQLYLPTFCTYKKSLVWLLSRILFWTSYFHVLLLSSWCRPCKVTLLDMLENPCPRTFYNSTNSELKWIMHTCWASQMAQW